ILPQMLVSYMCGGLCHSVSSAGIGEQSWGPALAGPKAARLRINRAGTLGRDYRCLFAKTGTVFGSPEVADPRVRYERRRVVRADGIVMAVVLDIQFHVIVLNDVGRRRHFGANAILLVTLDPIRFDCIGG